MRDQVLTRRQPRPGEEETRLLDGADLAFAPATYDAAAGTVDVVWSTGAAVRRFDWLTGEYYDEELDLAGADLARLQAGAPVLLDHAASVRNVAGSVVPGSARVEGGRGLCTLRFDRSSEEGRACEAKVAHGHLRHVSIGYRVMTWEKVETPGQVARWIARAWSPHEISFVPVPADAGAGTRGARGADAPANPTTTTTTTTTTKEGRMADIPNPGADAPIQAPEARSTLDHEAERKAVREAELARAQAIRAAGRALGEPDLAETLIEQGRSVEEAQRALIEAVAAKQRAQEKPKPATVGIVTDEGDTRRAALADAFMHRAGVRADLPEAARQFRGLRLVDFAAECVRLAGGHTRGLVPSEIAKLALGHRGMAQRAGIGMHTTSDFPNLLANTASKALGAGYSSARRTFTAFGRRRTLPDFKSFRVVNLAGAPQLLQIAAVGQEAGEIQFGTVGEGAETYQLFRAGRRISISFEAIVNDDMSGFSRVPQLFGTAAARLESETVYGIFNANPSMADGNALFGTAHVNVFGNGVSGFSAGDGVLNVTGLGIGRRVMRMQTAPNGDILDLTPRWLLVPAALEAAALQFTSMAYVASAPGSINPFANTLTPVVEPRLASATQWYLIADNAEVDTIEYAYLEGMESPEITTYTDEDTDGVIVKCTHNFGAKATDWRGMARSTGT
jgi:phage head maturation protease/phage major head subunit gpT-like protein